jgi:hypothetical protein
MTRQEANKIILNQISAMVEGAPDLRFHQILFNIGINKREIVNVKEGDVGGRIMSFKNEKYMYQDLYNEESIKTLERISKVNDEN